MYKINLTTKAISFLRKLPQQEREIVLKKLYSLRENPHYKLKKLKGSHLWRMRVAKYRAIIDVIVKGKRIIVLRIGKRKNVYD